MYERERPTLEQVLHILKKNSDKFVSGDSLSRELSVSRTAIWKHIRQLKKMGYEIDSKPAKGYRLLSIPDTLTPLELKSLLKTSLIGSRIHYFRETDSTNDDAFRMARKGEREGTVVIAEAQKKGKGRMGRRWESPPGVNLYLSIILRPKIPPSLTPQITLVAAISVLRAVQNVTGMEPEIKWPNDLLIRGKKFCGILTEIESEMDLINFVIVGIGVNINMDTRVLPADIRLHATSLMEELGRPIDRGYFTSQLLSEFENHYTIFVREGISPIINEMYPYLKMMGKKVKVQFMDEVVEGVAERLDLDGALLLKKEDGSIEKILAGDVTILKE